MADALTWRDRVLIILPMAFTGGTSSYLRESLVTGATAVIGATFDPPRMLELLERERITICSAVPVVWETLLVVPSLGSVDIPAVKAAVTTRLADYRRPRWITGFDAPLPRTLGGKIVKREIRSHFPEVPAGAVSLK